MTIEAPIEQPVRSGISRWGYLFFLSFVLIGPLFADPSERWRWVMEALVVSIAVGIYVWCELKGPPATLRGAVGLMALTVAATPFGSSALAVVPVYAGAFASTVGPRKDVLRRLAIITAVCAATMLISPIPWPYRAFLGISMIMVWFVGIGVHEDVTLFGTADALLAENARVQHLATVTERERIARDLHDVAGQTLTAMILRSQLLQRLAATDPEKAIAEAQAIESMSRELLSSFRDTVSGWQQASISDELDRAAEAMSVAGIQLIVSGQDGADGLAPSVETVLALTLREAITNVVRHSGADSCSVNIRREVHEVTLTVADDGVGRRGPVGSGLRGMRERVVAAGGRVDLSSHGGTTLLVTIPIGALS